MHAKTIFLVCALATVFFAVEAAKTRECSQSEAYRLGQRVGRTCGLQHINVRQVDKFDACFKNRVDVFFRGVGAASTDPA